MRYLIVLLALSVSVIMTSSTFSRSKLQIRCTCSKNEPICANDGMTYSSKCVYDCIINYKKKVLKEENPEKTFYIVDNKACPPNVNAKANCKIAIEYICPCAGNRKPVCGSDGKIYRNECMLDCEAKKVKGLHKVYFGACLGPILIQQGYDKLHKHAEKIVNKFSS